MTSLFMSNNHLETSKWMCKELISSERNFQLECVSFFDWDYTNKLRDLEFADWTYETWQ